jgi:hypothetical protein
MPRRWVKSNQSKEMMGFLGWPHFLGYLVEMITKQTEETGNQGKGGVSSVVCLVISDSYKNRGSEETPTIKGNSFSLLRFPSFPG